MLRIKPVIIMPAFNEEKTIDDVIMKIRSVVDYPIIIVNDSSTDNTESTIKKIQEKLDHIHILNHAINLGAGAALQTGVKFAILKKFDIFIQIDSDGQHPPHEIKNLLEPVVSGNADIVIGSRYLSKTNYKTSFIRRFGIKGSAKTISTLTGIKVTDINSGFRVFNIDVAQWIIKDYKARQAHFKFTLEIAKQGFIIKEIYVEMLNRQHGTSEYTLKRLCGYPIRISADIIKTEI